MVAGGVRGTPVGRVFPLGIEEEDMIIGEDARGVTSGRGEVSRGTSAFVTEIERRAEIIGIGSETSATGIDSETEREIGSGKEKGTFTDVEILPWEGTVEILGIMGMTVFGETTVEIEIVQRANETLGDVSEGVTDRGRGLTPVQVARHHARGKNRPAALWEALWTNVRRDGQKVQEVAA